MDSVRVELLREEDYVLTEMTELRVAALNDSGVPLEWVMYRMLDAEGRLVEDGASVQDVPAHGRAEGSWHVARGVPRPLRLEVIDVSVSLDVADRAP